MAKINAGGEYEWAKTFGGRGSDLSHSISLGTDGILNITGRATDTFWVDQFQFMSHDRDILVIPGGDIFWLRVDSDGVIQALHQYGGKKSEQGGFVYPGGEGNFYLVGRFSSDSILFDGQKLVNQRSIGGQFGDQEIFVSKFTSEGYCLWAKRGCDQPVRQSILH